MHNQTQSNFSDFLKPNQADNDHYKLSFGQGEIQESPPKIIDTLESQQEESYQLKLTLKRSDTRWQDKSNIDGSGKYFYNQNEEQIFKNQSTLQKMDTSPFNFLQRKNTFVDGISKGSFSLDEVDNELIAQIQEYQSNNEELTEDQRERCEQFLKNNPQFEKLFVNTSDPNQWKAVINFLSQNPPIVQKLLSQNSSTLSNLELGLRGINNQRHKSQLRDSKESSFVTETDESFLSDFSDTPKEGQRHTRSASMNQVSAKKSKFAKDAVERQKSMKTIRKQTFILTADGIKTYQQKVEARRQKQETERVKNVKMLHEAMAKVFVENLNYIHENNYIKFQTPIKIRLQHRKKENILNFIQDWSKVPLFSKVAHGRLKLSSEQKMLQEIDLFNKYIYMKGFEKTQLLRGLEIKLHDFVKSVKYELGMNKLQYQVNLNVGQIPEVEHNRGQSLGSIVSSAIKSTKESEQAKIDMIRQRDRKINSWMINSTIYDMCMDLMMCKKLFRFRTTMILIFQKLIEKDQQECNFCDLQDQYKNNQNTYAMKYLGDSLKRVINVNMKLKNLILYEYRPQAREFFTSHRFHFAMDPSENYSDFIDKLTADIDFWKTQQNL
ncbi:UNKNOWN [Stylonychia lemnae]|uniref:Uncharacterized protein n=1 Tax=Stylonychia lemnae TaxID=5949 RepID=A0A078AJZ5_STYLE|nr:UNKNOWN [Stylonychia lemnae]|eukprot:CDW82221.1 UNKNOWN [Stylonychia lemnae]